MPIIGIPSFPIESFSPSLEEQNPSADKSARIMSTLAWGVRCNIPLDKALLTLIGKTVKERGWNIVIIWKKSSLWKHSITLAVNDLKNGMPLSVAISHLERYLPPYLPSAIAEAERKEHLAELLPILAKQMNYVSGVYRRRVSAFSYPGLQFFYCFFIASGMIRLVLPRFQRIYEEMYGNHPLPALTTAVFHFGGAVSLILPVIGGIVIYYFIFRFFYRHEPTARIVGDFFMLPIPFIGKDMKKMALTELAGSMASFTKIGLDVITAAELSRETLSAYWLRKKLDIFIEDTKNGKKWIDAWEDMNLGFPFYNWIARNAASREKVSEGFMQMMKWLRKDISAFSRGFIRTIEVCGVLFNATFVGFIALGVGYGLFNIIYIVIENNQ